MATGAVQADDLLRGVKRAGNGKLTEPMVHGCGVSFTWVQSYIDHAKKCDGTKPATSGRIAARSGSASSTSSEGKKPDLRRRAHRADPPRAKASRKRSAVPRRTRHPKTPSAKVSRVPQKDVVQPLSPAAFLAALRAERAKIDAAIAAVEALA